MSRVLDPARLGDHVDRLYRAARVLCRSREQAEDLVQDTYVKVLSRPRLLRNDDDLGYLLTVMRNTFISNKRSARSRPALATADELERFADAAAPRTHDIMEALLVFEAIATLRRDSRDALVTVDVMGLRYREAARALAVPETTLINRLYRARERVAHMLRPELRPRQGRFAAAT